MSSDLATPSLDEARKEAFADRLVGVLNDAALGLMISIGHRTGLFDAMAGLPPSTSTEIARAARCNERYVREWLGALVTASIVDYDRASEHYRLPAEHAALLTRAAVPSNMAATTQWLSVMGGVESRIVKCFREGGGVPYEAYERFHAVMAEESAQTVGAALIESIIPLVEGLPARLEAGLDVLEIGCGAGRSLNLLAATYPNSRFTGFDISSEAVATAKEDAAARGSANVQFVVRDVAALGETGGFDLALAFDTIHDQVRPDAVLAGVHAALRSGGVFLAQDIRGHSNVADNLDHVLGPFMYTISCMHCMSVSLAADGAGLGAMWGQELALEMLGQAGFDPVTVETLEHDIMNNYYLARRR